jgi:hypothetical protein
MLTYSRILPIKVRNAFFRTSGTTEADLSKVSRSTYKTIARANLKYSRNFTDFDALLVAIMHTFITQTVSLKQPSFSLLLHLLPN